MMARAVLLVGVLVGLLGTSGCTGTMTATGAARIETQPATRSTPTAGTTMQLRPTLAWASAPGRWLTTARYAPSLTLDSAASPLLRQRITAEVRAARVAGLHPYGGVSVEAGTIRSIDLLVDSAATLVPLPIAGTLRSFAAAGSAGLQGSLTRRTTLRLGVAVDGSGGLGRDEAVLPTQTRFTVEGRGERRVSRHQRVSAALVIAHYQGATPTNLATGDVATTLTLAGGIEFHATAGAALSRRTDGPSVTAVRPAAGVGLSGATPRNTAVLRVGIATRPTLDRLDGALRQRVQADAALDVAARPGLHVGSRLQWSGDVGGTTPQRRLLSLDLTVRAAVTPSWSIEAGGRGYRQGTAGVGDAPSSHETRFSFGASHRLALR